jgi:hypothetical protein
VSRTEEEVFKQWLDTCPFEYTHIVSSKGKRKTQTRILFEYDTDSIHIDINNFKVGGTA